jgi:alkanesulfonate monooxygenase SsuD/methylene tetrahydromethanopterin reductase-like flavin-dependent oxidoreductase (luciferase family)
MKALWTQEDPVYEGRTFSIRGVRFNPKPVQKPHPPIIVGGTSESALKRTVRYGDGWYGIARSMDEARNLITRLREIERDARRVRPVEITLSLRAGHPLTADEVRQLADLGVERTLAGLPLRALEGDEVSRFRDEIMAKV